MGFPVKRACVLVRKKMIEESLGVAPKTGKRLLEPLKSFAEDRGLPVKILEDTAVVNDAEVHTEEGDLWMCLEGSAEFTYGGELVEPWYKENPDGTKDLCEQKAKSIRGGAAAVLEAGDWLWIPAGAPHQHRARGTARFAIVKIPMIRA